MSPQTCSTKDPIQHLQHFLVSIGTGLTSSMEGSGRAHNVHPGFKGAVSQNINVLVCQIPPFLISQIFR